MADGTIPLDAPTAAISKRLDTTELTVGGVVVERERVVLAGSASSELTDVKNAAPAATAYGVVTRNPAGASFTPTTATITSSTGTQIVVAARDRMGVIIRNMGSQIVYLGQGTITSTCWPLYPNGEALSLQCAGQINGLSSSGSQTLAIAEVY